MIKLYHGSNAKISVPDLLHSKPAVISLTLYLSVGLILK